MDHAGTRPPIPFEPAMEHEEEHEAEIRDDLIATLLTISETTFAHSGHAIRSVHAKSHALIDAEVEVLAGLPRDFAQGLFANPGRYKAVMRFSTNPGDILDDAVSAPRGLALKVVGVAGDRLPGSEGDRTQDFLMVDAPAFATPDAAAFLKVLKLLARTTDRVEAGKKALSGVLRVIEGAIEAFGGKSGTLRALGGHPMTHILGETFYSQTPFLYGATAAKFSLAPVSPGLTALTDSAVKLDGRHDAHRDEVNAFFGENGGEWELRAQLLTDLDAMPIEDASAVWSEDESPFVAVARVTAQPQTGWSPEKAATFDDQLSFSPWHGLAAHRPLGSINRVRKASYAGSVAFRARHNGCPIREPGRAGAGG